jgi:hypothetical protein
MKYSVNLPPSQILRYIHGDLLSLSLTFFPFAFICIEIPLLPSVFYILELASIK